MKRQTITHLILFTTIFLSCRQENKNNVEHKAEIDDSAIKISLFDTNYFDVARYKNFKDYADIQLKTFNEDEFNFNTPTKTYDVFYDKSYSHLVGKITYELKDSMVSYEMFDFQGNLRLNYSLINVAQYYGKRKTWYPNKVLESVETYYDNGRRLSDSSFFNNGKLKGVSLYTSDTLYKETNFYNNGNIKDETYNYRGAYTKIHGMETEYNRIFVINYDSITQKPSMFYSNDTISEDPHYPGVFLCNPGLIPADKAIVRKKK